MHERINIWLINKFFINNIYYTKTYLKYVKVNSNILHIMINFFLVINNIIDNVYITCE